MIFRILTTVFALFSGGVLLAAAIPPGADPDTVQTLHLVQDDAQDYMVSKVYVLKYVQSNDVTPFVNSIIKRYNVNSVANCIQYGNANQEILTVTCPVGMMPYVDDFIAKVDRKVEIAGKVPGEIIRGTGITRAVYRPKYRSGQILVNVIVNALINAGPYGSVYAYDQNSNQIYWKDNTSNSEFVFQFLEFLDRPAPQITLHFQLYEVRESTLRDLGIEYLAWKNGPGLNLFQVGWQAFDLSSAGSMALQAAAGPAGGFFFAPQFDASFIRLLEQSGKATLRNTAMMTVSNSETRSYSLSFSPELQNLTKTQNDQTEVVISSAAAAAQQISVTVNQPIACLHSGSEIDFTIPDYLPGQYAKIPGVLFFNYQIAAVDAVERNNYGAELLDATSISGYAELEFYRDRVLAAWERSETVEEVIGVPFLCDVPILKYLFSTTTTRKERTHCILTVNVGVLDTGHPSERAGELAKLK